MLYVNIYLTNHASSLLGPKLSNKESSGAPKGLRNTLNQSKIYMIDNSKENATKSWNDLVKEIESMYKKYEGFVVIADKDVIPHTATALSFMLENLSKPVIVTDSTLSKEQMKTKIPEVMVVSGGKLLRGTRTMQGVPRSVPQGVPQGVEDLTFFSPNFPVITKKNCFPKPSQAMSVKYINPNIHVNIIDMNEKEIPLNGLGGLIVQNIHGKKPSKEFLNVLQSLTKRGVVILTMSDYPNLKEAGVISAGDMTPAAAYVKLLFLLSHVKDQKIFSQLMTQSFRGEMTI